MLVKEQFCRSCGHLVDATTPAKGKTDHKPGPGDLSVCVYCGAFSKFDEELNLVALTDAEVEEIKTLSPTSWELLVSIARVIHGRIKKQ